MVGEETKNSDTFLEAIKLDYNYVKYNLAMSEAMKYYRFDLFREKQPEWYYKISLKFHTTEKVN